MFFYKIIITSCIITSWHRAGDTNSSCARLLVRIVGCGRLLIRIAGCGRLLGGTVGWGRRGRCDIRTIQFIFTVRTIVPCVAKPRFWNAKAGIASSIIPLTFDRRCVAKN